MPPSPLEYLRHIFDELAYLEDTSRQISEEEFRNSPTYPRAFARSFEIIGEATKQLDKPFREKHSTLPWAYMAKMRDKLIHHYFGIDYEMVWLTVVEDISELKRSVQALLQQMEAQNDSASNEE